MENWFQLHVKSAKKRITEPFVSVTNNVTKLKRSEKMTSKRTFRTPKKRVFLTGKHYKIHYIKIKRKIDL